MSFIKRSWCGEEKLWKVWWLYGVLLGGGLGILSGILSTALAFLLGAAALFLPVILTIPFTVWWFVAAWRCAFNVGARFWGYLARVLVVLGVIGVVFQLIAMLFLGGLTALGSVSKTAVPSVSASPAAVAPVLDNAMTPTTAAPDAAANPAAAACEKRMADYAIANHGDPKAYIAQNQAYLQQCIASGGK